MKPALCSASLETTLRCRVVASAVMRARAEEILLWKRQALVVGGESLSASFLKHSEDQTVLALHAVLQAIGKARLDPRSFGDWGAVAGPIFFGRECVVQALQRFQKEGAWGVSPNLIPHQSLHGLSGTISQALKIYGPNFGVGDGPSATQDAFLISAALLADGRLPGLWLVLTGHDQEVIPNTEKGLSSPSTCQAAVFALSGQADACGGLQLSIGQSLTESNADNPLLLLPEFQLSAFVEDWTARQDFPRGKWRLSETHWVEFETVEPETEAAP